MGWQLRRIDRKAGILTWCAAFLVGCLLVAGPEALAQTSESETPAPKQTPPANTQPQWAISCSSPSGDAPFVCQMQQELFVQETGRKILTASISGPVKSGETATMLLALPHGLYLPAGISIAVNEGEARKIDIQTSDANGVYAGVALDEKLLAVIKRGNTLSVTLTDTNRKNLVLPVNLAGFTAAFTRINMQR